MDQTYKTLAKYILFFALYTSLAIIGLIALTFMLLSNGIKPPINAGVGAALIAAVCFAVSAQFANGEKRVSTGKEAAVFAAGSVVALFAVVFIKIGAYMLLMTGYGASGAQVNANIIQKAAEFPVLGWIMIVILTVGFNLILLFAVFRTGTDFFSRKYSQ